MLLVTGGWGPNGDIDSTEIFDPDLGSWSAGAALPPRNAVIAATISNRVLLFGIDIFILS